MITLTESAKNRLRSILSTSQPESKLKLGVEGKGCAGLTYTYNLVQEVQNDDIVIVDEDVTVVIDNLSLVYLIGSTIDFVEDFSGSRFNINNPNSKSSCGCGESFNPY